MQIGEKIKHYRIKQKLTQEQLANKLFVSRKTISSWETGRSLPGISTLVELSSIFNISTDELLKNDEQINEHFKNQEKAMIRINYVELVLYIILFILTILSYLRLFGVHVFINFVNAYTLFFSILYLAIFTDWQRFKIRKKLVFLLISFFIIFIVNSSTLLFNKYLLTLFSTDPVENMASTIAILLLILIVTFSLVILINFFPKSVFNLLKR